MFKVQQDFCGHWEDAPWTVDDYPMRFITREEAQFEIEDHIADSIDAYESGYTEEAYSIEDYRIVTA
jgi:hypothetical protein